MECVYIKRRTKISYSRFQFLNNNTKGTEDTSSRANQKQDHWTILRFSHRPTIAVQDTPNKEAMAGENNLSASGKTSSDATNDIPTFSAENLQSNMRIIYYSRTFLSIIAGVISGIFGFTSLAGFIFYFCVMAITSVGLAAKTKFSINSYFDCWNRITLDGFLSGLMSYVLFWTFAYDLVHIF